MPLKGAPNLLCFLHKKYFWGYCYKKEKFENNRLEQSDSLEDGKMWPESTTGPTNLAEKYQMTYWNV